MNFAALSIIVAFFIIGAYSRVSEKCDDCMPDNSHKSPVCTVDSSGRYFATFKNKEIYECEKACGADVIFVKHGHCGGDVTYFYNTCGECRGPKFPDSRSREYCARINGGLDNFRNARAAYCGKICHPTIQLLHEGRCQMEEP